MKAQSILAAVLVATSSTLALADNSLSGKAMRELPGNNGAGSTVNPTAKPNESSLSGQAMRILPGNNGAGTTPRTQGNGDTTSLSGKAMHDLPGNN
ncbi:hypothetical protein [Hyphomicrobium sp. CS1GBMeth3]|uniref:hypothetical protein n=1 Tax=Hyphomicrobium sp. CS1GBMeth3 TaxID=1892845 RepID=UPI000930FB85|nr:hypothetical protein [Hyphomicrobium sp. CS1GBMeth3]